MYSWSAAAPPSPRTLNHTDPAKAANAAASEKKTARNVDLLVMLVSSNSVMGYIFISGLAIYRVTVPASPPVTPSEGVGSPAMVGGAGGAPLWPAVGLGSMN